MKKVIYTSLILCITILSACKNNNIIEVYEEPINSLPELSVYNLESEWITQDYKPASLINYKGDVVVVAMIYVTCKSACPVIISHMLENEKQLTTTELEHVKFILISIDPELDKPSDLKALASKYNMDESRWMLMSGTEENIRELALVLGFKYKKTTATDFAHSNIITILDTDGLIYHQQEGLDGENTKSVAAIKELVGKIK